MNWKLRATIFRILAKAPGGERLYQFLQARADALTRPEFIQSRLRMQRRIAGYVVDQGMSLEGARVMEVGTGWSPIIPLGWSLCGARSVDTFDLNRYYIPKVFRSALCWIAENRQWVIELFDGVARAEEIEKKITEVESMASNPDKAMEWAGIRYHAPADAARVALADDSIDIHYSANVFEHIPSSVLESILREARRVLKPQGLCVHHVDSGDHFAANDPGISRINFLQFDNAQWRRLGENCFAYHNRLRDGEYRQLFQSCEYEVVNHKFQIDQRGYKEICNGFPLAEAYREIDPLELCREQMDFIYRRRD